jgi:hypothetical protein
MPNGETTNPPSFFIILRDVLIAGVFATGIWVIAEKFQNLGYDQAANICDFSACLIFLCVLPYEIIKHNHESWLVTGCIFWAVVFTPLMYVFFGLVPRPVPVSYSHLKFGVETSETNSFWLTNDFLMNNSLPDEKSWIEKAVITNNSPYLLLTMMESQTNLGLLPLFANGPEADAENVHITILIFDELDCSAEKDWRLTKSEHETQLDWQTAFVAKNSSFELPRIFLNDPASDFIRFSKTYSLPRVPIAMLIEAKNAPLERLLFWLMFAISSETNEFPAKMGIYGGSQVEFNTNRMTIHY